MLYHIVARGKIGRSPEADLVERYAKRLSGGLKITELPDQGGKMPAEPSYSWRTVLLDERGKQLTSLEFSEKLQVWQDEGVREVRFMIGAADGFDEADRGKADMLLSFGRCTWPHMIARAMLAEQIYRATTIQSGHPYHREG